MPLEAFQAKFGTYEGSRINQRILEITAGRGLDVAFDAVGLKVTFEQALACLTVGGRLVAPLRPEQVRLPTDRIEDPRAIDVLIDGEGYRPKALKPVPGTAAPADAPAQEKEKGYEF